MAPSYRKLVTQTSSLSSTGNNTNVGQTETHKAKEPVPDLSKNDLRCSGPATSQNSVADPNALVVSAQGQRGGSGVGCGSVEALPCPNGLATATSQNDPGQLLISAAAISTAAAAAAQQAQRLYPQAPRGAVIGELLAPLPQPSTAVQQQPGQPNHQKMSAALLHRPMPHLTKHTASPDPGDPKPNIFKGMELRRGKWTQEEERYASRLIEDFEKGIIIDCENGTTLRAFLSRKLHCAPMRISKKFAGKSIGKHVFLARSVDKGAMYGPKGPRTLETLKELEASFYRSLSTDGNGVGDPTSHIKVPLMTPSRYFPSHQFSHNPHSLPLPAHPVLFHGQASSASANVAHVKTTQTIAPIAKNHHAMPIAPQSLHQKSVTIMSATGNVSSAGCVAEIDHAKHLRQSYLNAIGQASETDNAQQPKPSSKDGSSISGNNGVFGNEAGYIPTIPASTAQAHAQPSPAPVVPPQVLPKEAIQNISTNCTAQPNPSADYSNIPELLAGFEKVAPSLLPPPNPSSTKHAPPTPTYTSKSFDELHHFLGNDSMPQSFQLGSSSTPTTQMTGGGGPASKALRKQESEKVHTAESNQTAPTLQLQGLPKPALPGPNFPPLAGANLPAHNESVTADAYAMFAQQSVLAVSQHSAYCRSEPFKYPGVMEPPFFLQKVGAVSFGHELQRACGEKPGITVIEDEESTTSTKFNAANLKAHMKATEAKTCPPSFSQPNEILLGQHHKRARTTPGASGNYITSTSLSRHANMVSGSERSSDMGTESESAIGSSHASSAGSGSENASDNGSDNSSDQSEPEGFAKSKGIPARASMETKHVIHKSRKRKSNSVLS